MAKVTEFIRSLVRPLSTVGLLAVASFMILRAATVPDWYQTLVVSALAYWFGSRTTNGHGTP